MKIKIKRCLYSRLMMTLTINFSNSDVTTNKPTKKANQK